jgi:phosphopantetheinyl transferase (holo-ACP synthase)
VVRELERQVESAAGRPAWIEDVVIAEANPAELSPTERGLWEDLQSPTARAAFAAGRVAAHRAIWRAVGRPCQVLREGDGAPRIDGPAGTAQLSLSITHGRRRALAIVARVPRLGIDHCDLEQAPRLEALAERFLRQERPLLTSAHALAACWAAREAALKALRVGIVEGGVLGPAPPTVWVASLEPPRLVPDRLHLAFGETPEGPVAVVWQADPEDRR